MTDTKFPDTFLWGAATAAYQVEGGITNNDWNFFTTKY
jgi:beta-glucosidase/6-phospho-beta-glucosidase/beta-galactosidase